MRRYDDPVEVHRGRVDGAVEDGAPEQFLWRGRLWKVRTVLACWVETGPWWHSREVTAVLGVDADTDAGAVAVRTVPDLLGERQLWRVEAGRRGRAGGAVTGVFELSLDHTDGRWALVGCVD